MWRELRGARLFITGGTGFWGTWLLEGIAAANDRLGADITATLLSRDPAHFRLRLPHLAGRPEFNWLAGDCADVALPAGPIDHVIHLATASAAEVGSGGTAPMLRTLAGTARMLDFARHSGARRFLLASSGAVYGKQPADLGHIPEYHHGAPDLRDPASAYGEIKRFAELMCATADGIECVMARGFAFIGPHLPLSDKFAAGSFLRDALHGGPIRISGDGTPIRSYLYASDLIVWLLTILLRGTPGQAYNVGSDQPTSLAALAQAIATASGGARVDIAKAPSPGLPERYVPSIEKARRELGLEVRIPLTEALRRTIEWARRSPPV